MPKPLPGREPDPMARVVDRLLSQLPGLQGGPDAAATVRRSAVDTRPYAELRTSQPRSQHAHLGLWIRLVLGLALGAMILGWPYFRGCGLPLFGYLTTVAVVLVVAGWAAVSAWHLRSGIAHILSLMLFFWGAVLTANALLPRTGYAAVSASWQCGEPGSDPSWMRWFAPPE